MQDILYGVTICHSSVLRSEAGISTMEYIVAIVPPEMVPLTLKKDWDFVMDSSGRECCSVRSAE